MSVVPAGYPTDQVAAFELLSTRARLAIDDIKVLAMLETAGEAFYQSLAAAVDNDAARALLSRNSQEERGHAHRLLKAIKLLGGEDFSLPEHAHNPYVSAMPAAKLLGSEAFFAALEQGELAGELQYEHWADAEANPEVAKIYRQNGSEEARHGARVAEIKRLLQ